MGRIKPNNLYPVKDLASANAAMAEIAGIKRSIAELERTMNDSIDLIKAEAERVTDLTLGERRNVIAYLSLQGAKVKNPYLPVEMVDWVHGDPEKLIEIRKLPSLFPGRPPNMDDAQKGPLLKKIEALLADNRRPWAYVHKMAQHMFDIHAVHWCRPDQLHKIVAALVIDAKRHGRFTGT